MFDSSITRRRLLAAMALSPLLMTPGISRAAFPELHRIVALEWLPVELLLALGVVPLAIADARNYRLWVGQPALPDGVVDVGLRTEPNLELLSQLHPSLILYSAGYGPAPDKIERIAPGMGINFSDGSQPLTSARASLKMLGERLGLRQRARAHLEQFDAFMTNMTSRFAPWRGQPLLLMSLMDARHALIIGKNSLFQQVMDELGLENAWQGEVNFWGSAVVSLERLATVNAAQVVCFAHGDDVLMRQIAAMPLWQAMPFVRQNRFRRVPAVWFYGATLSAMHFCRVLDSTLGARP